MAKIIDGKQIAAELRAELKEKVAAFAAEAGRLPGLAVILVGEDPASQVYVRNKIRGCEEVGIQSFCYRLPESVSEAQLKSLICELNDDPHVDGILVQLPLPRHLDEQRILACIAVEKDVDGFHVQNAGNLMLGKEGLTPCTPAGCIRLIESTGISIEGKHAVVIGRSNIVGKPMALLLLQKNATVTVGHSRTRDLGGITRQADILVSAVGKADFVTADMVKPGAVVIDVGMNRKEGKLCGDVAFDEVFPVAGFLTPVPGGVGPMTIAMLLSNTLKAARSHG